MAFAIDLGNLNSTITTVVRSGVDVILNEVRFVAALRSPHPYE